MPWTNNEQVGYQPIDTSLDAAIAGEKTAPILRTMILNFLRQTSKGWTSEEIAHRLDLDYRSVQPRLSELRDAGKVYDTGTRRMSERNRLIIVWKSTPKETHHESHSQR